MKKTFMIFGIIFLLMVSSALAFDIMSLFTSAELIPLSDNEQNTVCPSYDGVIIKESGSTQYSGTQGYYTVDEYMVDNCVLKIWGDRYCSCDKEKVYRWFPMGSSMSLSSWNGQYVLESQAYPEKYAFGSTGDESQSVWPLYDAVTPLTAEESARVTELNNQQEYLSPSGSVLPTSSNCIPSTFEARCLDGLTAKYCASYDVPDIDVVETYDCSKNGVGFYCSRGSCTDGKVLVIDTETGESTEVPLNDSSLQTQQLVDETGGMSQCNVVTGQYCYKDAFEWIQYHNLWGVPIWLVLILAVIAIMLARGRRR